MTNEIAIIGAGGHAKVVIATARALGWTVACAYDDDEAKAGGDILGVPIQGAIEMAAGLALPAVVALGDNRSRSRVADTLALDWQSLVHPAAHVGEGVTVEAGAVVFAGAVVQPASTLGAHSVVNTGATVDHDCRLGRAAHIAPGAHLAGGVKVGRGALVGIGAAVINGLSVGAGAVVGAGAAVTRDVAEGTTVAGVPARTIRP